ncbi:conserved hypothetical protein [delta proteobacterium NaphS2]|nr:conserved hypothetical protein [delta proteobacterium NaphS2]
MRLDQKQLFRKLISDYLDSHYKCLRIEFKFLLAFAIC